MESEELEALSVKDLTLTNESMFYKSAKDLLLKSLGYIIFAILQIQRRLLVGL